MIERCKVFCGWLVVGVVLFSSFFPVSQAAAISEKEIPDVLKPWVAWVLHDKQDHFCPAAHNNPKQVVCNWPGRLSLEVSAKEARFEQQWTVYNRGAIVLPGAVDTWPQQVKLNGQPATVLERQGRPVVRVEAGKHRIEGVIHWVMRPTLLNLPPQTGLLQLTLDGALVAHPEVDSDGSLHVRSLTNGGEQKDWLRARVYRHIVDDVPLRVETLIDLDVSGSAREIVLGPALLDGFIPVSIDSDIPARVDPDGRLRLQLRPGNWQVTLTTIRMAPTHQLSLPAISEPWPGEEVWVFEARPGLRVVDISGATSIDASQTDIIPEWSGFPAYLLKPGNTLQLTQVRRGAETPEPDKLSLHRRLWLDFDGGGYTFRDTIAGKKTANWRMEAMPTLLLGRVVLQEEDQVITRLPDSDRLGVEVRHTDLSLHAEGRIEGNIGSPPVNGWGQEMREVTAQLNLPPGWRLWGASGVDRSRDDWISRWTLLDFFLVLLATIAAFRLWGWPWAALTLTGLALSWHEPNAPQLVWFNLFAVVALRRVALKGALQKVVRGYFLASLILFLWIAVPFTLQQIRTGLYPQLERVGWRQPQPELQSMPSSVPTDDQIEADIVQPMLKKQGLSKAIGTVSNIEEITVTAARRDKSVDPSQWLDPNARIQTGPGLPNWRWRTARLEWHGRVADDHRIRLLLMPPWLTRMFLFAQLALLLGLVARLCNLSLPAFKARMSAVVIGAFGAGLLAASAIVPNMALAETPAVKRPLSAAVESGGAYPSPQLLKQLQERLLQAPDCAPRCAAIENAIVLVEGNLLTVELVVHSGAQTALPLPAGGQNWLPREVRVDNKPTTALRQSKGALWVALAAGRHRVELSGPVLRPLVRLPFGLVPHRIEVSAEGWEVTGIDQSGHTDGQVQLLRATPERSPHSEQVSVQQLPPLLTVTRTIELGLSWRVSNHVERQTAAGQPVLLKVPLLPGESVLTKETEVRDGHVLISLAPDQHTFFWESSLYQQPELTLTAVNNSEWVEVWQVVPGYIWNLQYRGLPTIYQQLNDELWLPQWRPWPGEQVTLQLVRPEGVAGNTYTIDSSRLAVTPGLRISDVALQLTMRSNQGGNHSIYLPEGAQLQSMTLNGRALPARQEGNNVILPLTPGELRFDLLWREETGTPLRLQTPQVDLGSDSVNTEIAVNFPRNRWVLWASGPPLGPAVLFWGVLVAIAVVAWGLAKTRYTPLNFWQWALLLVGLSQAPLPAAGFAVAWLFVLAWREKAPKPTSSLATLGQIGLVVLTIAALASLYLAIYRGLLGQPEMQITGNFSSASNLNWYADKTSGQMPVASVYSVPLWVYRVFTLAWALWIAWSLLGWLRWGWQVFLHSAPVQGPKVKKVRKGESGEEKP